MPRVMASLHDLDFDPPADLPFPPGTSPFRQKGNAYLGDVRYLDATVSGGFRAVVAAIPHPATRAFFQQTTLQLAGAREAKVSILEVTPDGHDHRRDLVKVELRLRWG